MAYSYLCGEYDRLSKEDLKKDKGKDESNSIASQHLIIESYAEHNNLTIVERYIDDGFSGGNFDRPEFQRMIDDIENGKINCVITKDLSRLGRELYKTGTYIETYFLEKGVRYIAINDGYDSDIGDSMLGLRLGVNDLYLRDTSRKVKGSLRAKQEKGDYIGSFPAYGYMKDPEDRHRLIIDPETAPIVKYMGECILAGKGSSIIADDLTSKGIPIPSVYKKEPRAKKITLNDGKGIWRPQTILNILRSEMYIGNMVQNTYNKLSYTSKKLRNVDKQNWIIVENTHEAIFDKETFERIQVELDKKKKYTAKREEMYLFQGLLKCKECGHSISILKKTCKKEDSKYTECNYHTKTTKYGLCSSHRINYTYLESDLLEYLKQMGMEFLEQYETGNLIKTCEEFINGEGTKINEDIKKITTEITKNEVIKNKIYSDRLEDIITVSEYKELASKYRKTLEELNDKRMFLHNKLKEAQKSTSKASYEKCKNIVSQYLSLEDPTREIINQMIDKIEIDKYKTIDVYFKIKAINLVKV